ncbi:YybH family protein [Namhaeicola litoreus]|uniref:YybH family protein n=1 Tax=Namhaeicola litoreus TaxID=1052145 RepID=A0ABW3Y298_9FLAO
MRKLLILLFIFSVLSCQQNDQKSSAAKSEKADIEQLLNDYLNAWNKGDIDTVSEQFSPDGVVVNGGKHYKGLVDINRGWLRLAVGFVNNIEVAPYVSGTSGDVAYLSGKYTLDLTQNNGETTQDSGNLSLVWKRLDNNQWKLSLVHIEAFK